MKSREEVVSKELFVQQCANRERKQSTLPNTECCCSSLLGCTSNGQEHIKTKMRNLKKEGDYQPHPRPTASDSLTPPPVI